MVEVPTGNPPVRLFEGGANPPTDRSYFHAVRAGFPLGVKPAANEKVWVWSDSPSRLVVTET